MRNLIVMVLATMFAWVSTADDAEARRARFSLGGGKSWSKSSKAPRYDGRQQNLLGGRRFFPVLIPIPSGGSSIVFVKDLPDRAEFRHQTNGASNGHFDLGYKFSMLGGGEWVGYLGSRRSYLELDQDYVRQSILPIVGLTDADAPTRGAGAQATLLFLWGIIAMGALAFLMLRFPAFRQVIFSLRGRKREDEDDVKMPVYGRRFTENGLPKVAMSAPAAPPPSAAPAYGRPGPAAFGKRR